jgi:hypothetical protein
MRRPRLLHWPLVLVPIGLAVAVVAVGLVAFQPWKLWVDRTVDEAVPTAVALTPVSPGGSPTPNPGPTPSVGPATSAGPTPSVGPTTSAGPTPGTSRTPSQTPKPTPTRARTLTPAATRAPAPVTLARGTLISHEHETTGTVRVLRLADGSRILRLQNLDTSNGPDLRVWITDAPVIAGRDGWHVFDDGAHVSLGRLKGNRGSQNYALPPDLDLDRFGSVTIWCDRFNVSFGAARLASA